MGKDDSKDEKREAWGAVADGWDRHRENLADQSHEISEWMVDHLDLRPGDVVLDLAAGNGETSFLASPRVGDSGRVIVTDLSPAMLATAERAALALGLRNLEFRVADLEDLPLDDRSVDAVLCRWGYQQVPDPRRAFHEAFRVLRSHRQLCLSVWADDAHNPLDASVPAALAKLDAAAQGRAAVPPHGPTLDSAEEVGTLLCEADFTDVLVQEVPMRWRFADDEGLWEFVVDLFSGAAVRIAALDAADRESVRASLMSALAPYREGGAYDIPALCLNATGSRP